jgi:hypothetical protein
MCAFFRIIHAYPGVSNPILESVDPQAAVDLERVDPSGAEFRVCYKTILDKVAAVVEDLAQAK